MEPMQVIEKVEGTVLPCCFIFWWRYHICSAIFM
jgi:hypothetical protein